MFQADREGRLPPSCPIGSRRPLSADLWVRSMGIKLPPKLVRYRCNCLPVDRPDINLPNHVHSHSKNVRKLRAFAYFSKGFHSACESSLRSHRRCGSHNVLQFCEIHQTLRTNPAMATSPGTTRTCGLLSP